jgi:hypothetical protein
MVFLKSKSTTNARLLCIGLGLRWCLLFSRRLSLGSAAVGSSTARELPVLLSLIFCLIILVLTFVVLALAPPTFLI